MLITYLLVIGLGVYCYQVLHNSTAFFACIFLPLILLATNKLIEEWVNNEYQMLANIPEYNRRIEKMNKVIEKKEKAIAKQKGKSRMEGKDHAEVFAETDKVLIKSNDNDLHEHTKSNLLIKS